MQILVCFSIVDDLSSLPLDSYYYQKDNDTDKSLHTSHIRKIISAFDESALEFALRYKNENDTVTSLTIGSETCDTFSRLTLATGFNKAIRINIDKDTLKYSSYVKAAIIAKFIKQNNYDLICTGAFDAHNYQGMTSLYLSSILNIPCFNNVQSIKKTEQIYEIICKTTFDLKIYKCKGPCILNISNIENLKNLRIPTLMQKLEAKKQKIDVIEIDDALKKPLNDIEILDYKELCIKRNTIFFKDDDCNLNIDTFLDSKEKELL